MLEMAAFQVFVHSFILAVLESLAFADFESCHMSSAVWNLSFVQDVFLYTYEFDKVISILSSFGQVLQRSVLETKSSLYRMSRLNMPGLGH
ncbi:hypothetical protein NPIL_638511 [Nephila pilipes]|uniref:Secreted protein n=1 Tax=Nephila pilipes TaxID=299642 RepID=A0A8X6MXN3_NEPPI|nr:hypothetical protein NPIL_638511 [Nephila pilipes]